MSEQIPPPRRRRPTARAATAAHVNGAGEPRLAEIAAERVPERIAEPIAERIAERIADIMPAARAEVAADVDLAAHAELAPEQRSAGAQSDQGAVVITGICGRMGLLLARKLHRHQRVVGIDRRRFEGRPEDIVHHQLDLRRRQTRDIFRAGGIRAVVHLGIMHDLRESDRTHHEWNVVGFQKLLEYLSQYQVPKLILLSSATLYGPSPDNAQFLSEEAPLLGAQEFSRIRDLVEVDML
ncbi:MAG TPA: NAD-dependent epimerase/dehydratase family protein, partial [Polyangiales bacterium]|nr:NAD-dependent epimerase/dehydratase family protein [Polyangiales bacterium]